ncbi:MAG: hypothetical protein WCP31_07840 [Chloroflexales bacterium]
MTSSNGRRRQHQSTPADQGAKGREAHSRSTEDWLQEGDLPPSARHKMPTPLDDYFDDLDGTLGAAMPTKVAPHRPADERTQPSATALSRQTAPVAPHVAPKAPPPSPEHLVTVHFSLMHEAQARMADATAKADIERIEHRFTANRSLGDFGAHLPPLPPAQTMRHWTQLGVIMLVSVLVIFALAGGSAGFNWSRWTVLDGTSSDVQHSLAGLASPAGDYTLRAPPSITAQQIDRILAAYGSPAAGTGADWYNLGLKYGIDPTFAVAFFIMESKAGTAPGWAGFKPDGGTTHNVGNIICAGYTSCFQGHRDYPTWAEGIEGWFKLIQQEYIEARGHKTIGDVLPVYCPFSDGCRPDQYTQFVEATVDRWRSGVLP